MPIWRLARTSIAGPLGILATALLLQNSYVEFDYDTYEIVEGSVSEYAAPFSIPLCLLIASDISNRLSKIRGLCLVVMALIAISAALENVNGASIAAVSAVLTYLLFSETARKLVSPIAPAPGTETALADPVAVKSLEPLDNTHT